MNPESALPRTDRARTLIAVALLGFASGLPVALSGGTLEAWCAVSGLSLKTIGFVKLVASAYVFKFLWAPLLDRYSLPWLCRRRGWMVAMQLGAIVTLVLMAGLSPSTSLTGIALLAIVLATFSATQDIVVDAYRTDQLAPQDRGLGAALGVGGYRLAMLASGGMALILADAAGWSVTYLSMAALLCIGLIGSALAPERELARPPQTVLQAYVEPFRDFFSRRNALIWLALILTYKFGNAFAQSLSSTFLLRDGGYSLSQVGWVNKVFALGAAVVGALLGGLVLERWSLWRALMVFGIVQGLCALGFYAVSLGWHSMPGLITAVTAEYLGSGLGTAAFVALLMSLCNVRFSAAQYALFSALDSIPRVFIGPFAGWLAETHGWPTFFIVATVSALPGLLILHYLRSDFAQRDEMHLMPKSV